MKTSAEFEEGYAKLNAAQKEAVDTVEGPVMVIAGPGTGKTHILTLRIANILRLTQNTSPENILVLTFTDSAARTVAKRLAGLIGEETARKVGTYTFHSFAEHIMKEHPEAFAEYADRRLMGEVEAVLVWRDVFENLKESKLRTAKSPFHYLKDLLHLEDTLTREQIEINATVKDAAARELAEWRQQQQQQRLRLNGKPSNRTSRVSDKDNPGTGNLLS